MIATITQGADFHSRGFGAHSRSVSPSLGVHGTFYGGSAGTRPDDGLALCR